MSVGFKRFLAKYCCPYFVSVEPADFCQLRCPQCPVGRRGSTPQNHRTLSLYDAERILQHLPRSVKVVQFYFQGEPLLNRELPAIIRAAHQSGRYTTLSTNAQALTLSLARELVDSGLNRIIVSVDGLHQSTYSAYRQGGNLQRTLAGLGYLREAKNEAKASIHIELQCLRLRSNEREWQQFRKEYKSLGADSLTFKTAQFYDYEQGNPLMPTDTRFSRYQLGKDGRYHLKHQRRICRRVLTGCIIDVEGNVLPCCFDKSRQYVLGNILAQSLMEIWHSDNARSFRESVLQRRYSIPICQNCTE